ncbi:FecR domain-containing protein [Sphingomonas sp.]|uniref:FecR family protein n=1 Tax=Sphingomonas sp. TaxID=28214 RepID=UPI0025DB6FFF|nr:FecR domain-containing protein [Sphingomonas sp.]
MTDARSRPSRTLERAASLWVARHSLGPLSDEQRAQFLRWQEEDPAHAQAFQRMSSTLAAFDQAGPVVRDTHKRALATERRRRRAVAGLGVTAVAVIVTVVNLDVPARFADLRTGRGESRQMVLADGSRLWLDADSAVDIAFDARQRHLQLVRGRIHVEVAHEARPFDVAAGGGVVRDIGTGFDVERGDGQSRAIVTNGLASARANGTAVILHAGEGASWTGNGAPSRLEGSALGDAISWRDGRLSFSRRPLSEVVAVLDRYSSRRLVLLNAAAGHRLVSGVVRTRQADRDIAALAQSQGLSTTDIGIAILLR